MSEPRDITEFDTGRGGRGPRLLVLAVAVAVIGATLVAVQPRARPVAQVTRPAATPAPLPRSSGLLAAAFPDGLHAALMTGDGVTGGRVWTSLDGGRSWSLGMQVPEGTVASDLWLSSSGSGSLVTYAVPGGLGVTGLWLTADGGHSFEQHPFPQPVGFRPLAVTTPPDGSAQAFFSDGLFPPTALFYRRGTGGDWTQAARLGPGQRPTSEPLKGPVPLFGSRTAMAFLDARHGAIATQSTGGLAVFTTADGGSTWSPHSLGPPPDGEELPAGSLTLEVVGGRLWMAAVFPTGTAPSVSYLYESSDGGASWDAPIELPTSDGLEAPAFAGPTVWWVPDGDSVLRTEDAGAHWLRGALNLPGTTVVERVFPIDDRRAWAFAGASPGPPQLLFETSDGGYTWNVVKPPG